MGSHWAQNNFETLLWSFSMSKRSGASDPMRSGDLELVELLGLVSGVSQNAGGFQLVMGVPQKRWIVFIGEHPSKKMDDRGYPYDLRKPQINRIQ